MAINISYVITEMSGIRRIWSWPGRMSSRGVFWMGKLIFPSWQQLPLTHPQSFWHCKIQNFGQSSACMWVLWCMLLWTWSYGSGMLGPLSKALLSSKLILMSTPPPHLHNFIPKGSEKDLQDDGNRCKPTKVPTKIFHLPKQPLLD